MQEMKEVIVEKKEEISREEKEDSLKRFHREKTFLIICVIITILLIIFSSILTDSSLLLTFIGFLPLLITIFIFLWAVEQRFKRITFLIIPPIIAILFLGIGGFFNAIAGNIINVGGLAVINMILGLVIVFVLLYQKGKGRTSLFPEKKKDIFYYVNSIEDKCKAINSVIGRVYKTANGGTEEMRNKIKVQSELYNKFDLIRKEGLHKHKREAAHIIEEVLHSLKRLENREKIVFTQKELKGLKNIIRDENGEDKVITVLMVNDKDPIDEYYEGAVTTCENILKTLT